MANQIGVRYDGLTNILSKIKPAYFCKAEIHNESKTVMGRTIKLTFGNEREYVDLPSYQQNGMFILSR